MLWEKMQFLLGFIILKIAISHLSSPFPASSKIHSYLTSFDSGIPQSILLLGDAVNLSHTTGGVSNSGCLQLTTFGTFDASSMAVFENITNEEVVDGFDVSWDMKLLGGAYGLSFFFGDFNSETLPSHGEKGPDDLTGVSVSFSTFYDTLSILVDGTSIQIAVKSVSNGVFVPVRVQLSDGQLTVTYNDNIIHDAVEVYHRGMLQSGRFGFAARSGSLTEDAMIDNVVIQASSVEVTPSPTFAPTFIYSNSFYCAAYSITDSSTYVPCYFTVCPRDVVELSGCGCNGDVYFELYTGSAVVDANKYSCDHCPFLSHEAEPNDYNCVMYELRQHCASGSCSGETHVMITSKCEDGWKLYETSCFNTFETADYWEGKMQCEAQGGHTATISSAEHNAWVARQFADSSPFRIGYNDIATESKWEWEYKNSDYSNLENMDDYGDCVEVWRDGMWEIVDCEVYQNHLCQLPCGACRNATEKASRVYNVLLLVSVSVAALVFICAALHLYMKYSRRKVDRDALASIGMVNIATEAICVVSVQDTHMSDACIYADNVVVVDSSSQEQRSDEICVVIPDAVDQVQAV